MAPMALKLEAPKSVVEEPTVYNASSVESIRNGLAALHTREVTITSSLNSLVSSQAELSRKLGRLDLLRAHLSTQVISTRSISHGMLDNAANTAQHLSGKVNELDLEKKRVEETLAVVEQVAELKACVQGVVGSMGAPQDWEAAAGYIARANRVPDAIIQGGFAVKVVPSVEVPDAPGVTLENAKESLCGLFLREFEKAAAESDGAKVTRFFKLFPLIGRTDVGLDVYGKYVCQGVAGTARKNMKDTLGKDGYYYANALTKLFEHIAQIIDGHGGLVERHYGAGKMVKVIERLQVEADVQAGIILDTWGDQRNVDRRIMDVKSYPYSFLVQSYLPRPIGMQRTSSPAPGIEDDGVDLKEVDGILGETAVMLSRWALYSRFLAGKCKTPDSPDTALLHMPDFLLKSALNRKVAARLTSPFNEMSTFFLRRSVEKAFQMEESPPGLTLNFTKPIDSNPPYTLSAVDDVMYIVNAVLQRSLSTSQRDIVASVVPTVGRVLGADFIGMLQRKMRDESYPKPVIQGGFPPEDKIVAFIVLINSLDVSNDYIARIVSTKTDFTDGSESLEAMFPFDHDGVFVRNALTTLVSTFTSKSSELITDGLHVMFNQVIKPRLRPILTETFRDIDYSMTEEEFDEMNEDEGDDVVTRRFGHSWELLMKPIQRIMTARSFDVLLEQTARYLSRWMEKRIWSFSGKANAFGGVRIERDFSGIITVMTKGGKYGLKELFGRVSQILTIINMEADEWEELEAMDYDWLLSNEERERAHNFIK